ncbi:hypothetical protein A7E78_04010 [Syntrophotalea acetylenivorans]|uniref:Uncharacterized protein n=1 Tax=Syntrophotalea acetylenivorans TaxID=1842532 RepID=A0A1L3GMF5_9BACT|nr:hypothetical protein [Syntrophotalea acetylenivorans]APG27071.1 hypothetical protein A7E78_04010 [Syntrophotalea acetylenivorans]
MSLLQLWKTNGVDFQDKKVQQLTAIAGDGTLKDGNKTSLELRELFSAIPTEQLGIYLRECLEKSFLNSGLVLQDIVNELGQRLDCDVKYGLYQGKVNAIGFDGIWTFPNGYSIVVEVKTTDAYTINLDKIADYRKALIAVGEITENSSILIVVGRKDTNSLEAQVRGSRHAWDMRLISAEALIKLVDIKEAADDQATITKIRSVLTPLELTKLDFVVDLLATTAEDLHDVEVSNGEEETTSTKEKKFVPVGFNKEVAEHVAEYMQKDLKRTTRTLYATVDKSISVRCLVSKSHITGDKTYYWYAYHPHFNEVLEKYKESYLAFGCGSPEKVLLLKMDKFVELLPKLNVTNKEDRMYWHVHFFDSPDGKMCLHFKGGETALDVTEFLV